MVRKYTVDNINWRNPRCKKMEDQHGNSLENALLKIE